LMCIEVIA